MTPPPPPTEPPHRRRTGTAARWVAAGVLLSAAGAAAFLLPEGRYDAFLAMLRNDVSTPGFLLSMGLLPALGLPISPFLVLSGLKFGFPLAVALAGLATLLHLLIAFGVGRSVLRPVVASFLERRRKEIPTLARPGRRLPTFLFVVVPGLPYSFKNYLLALGDLPLAQYVGLVWTGQMTIALPFIGLGEAAAVGHGAVAVAAVLLAALAVYGRLRGGGGGKRSFRP